MDDYNKQALKAVDLQKKINLMRLKKFTMIYSKLIETHKY